MSYQGPERRTVITFTRADSDRLVRLEEQIIANNAKLDQVLKTVTEKESAISKTITSHEERIGKVERTQSWLMGIGAAITFAISCVVAFLRGWFRI